MADPFWRRCVLLPVGIGVLLLVLIWSGNWDADIARAFFFRGDPPQWLGQGAGNWWARRLLHTGGRDLIRVVMAIALLVWALSYRLASLRALRASAGYVALSMIVATATVGGLKAVTNVDCPWDLEGFGGTRPHVAIFGDRPDSLPRAKCFPGAHSASGFALLCFYFVFRDRRGRAKYLALGLALATGILFAFGQEARGAHFVSHDLTGALIAWTIVASLYAGMLKPRRGDDGRS